MNPMELNIEFSGNAAPNLERLANEVQHRGEMNISIANAETEMFREYLRGQADVRHASANALGAAPTKELEKASSSVEGTAEDDGARISFGSAYLFARAFGAVDIRPGAGRSYLTIPANAAAYGKRAGDFAGSLVFLKLGPQKKPVLATRAQDGGIGTVMFRLVTKVHQEQDRDLLPSDEMILTAAEAGATDVANRIWGGQAT